MNDGRIADEIEPGTALVTGAARRVGAAIARDLARAGWSVAVHYNDSDADAKKTVAAITEAGGRAALVKADLRDEAQVQGLVAAAERALGPVSLLVNNASVFENDTPLTEDRALWDLNMEVNLRAPFVLAQQMVRRLPEQMRGNIVNIVDQRVLSLTPFFTSYTVSKVGLWTLTQTLAQAWAPRIRVNAIGPGPVLPSPRQTDQQFEKQYKAMPLARAVDVAEIANAVRFILASQSMTGQIIVLDAGQHLGWAQPSTTSNPEE
jgi:NAD(P)-dependent dehydrogenase (short-subunit alcohol dehydrogenase family)